MRRRLDQLLPALVLIGFLATAVVINLMLSNAEDRGVEALEDSSLAEVQAISRSQNQRFDSQLSGIGSFLDQENPPYELTVGSRSDLGKLNKLLELVERNPDFRTGFYVLDLDGTVTQGVRLLDDTSIGKAFEWPGYEELTARQEFATSFKGGILPVSKGLTTNEPVIATVVPIGTQGTPRRGAFVFESTVADSDFNEEINKLSRGDTGEYLVYDQMGSVVASNDPGLLGNPLGDERLVNGPLGVHRYDDQIVVMEEMTAAGWRVAFRQDVDEFEEGLVGPLETVGRLIVLAILAAGFALTIGLYQRLRAARAEQERLRVLSESQQELISIVSHELRTPVAGVLGFLETTLDHWEGMSEEERRTAVTRAAANAQRLQAMTRDVLDTQSVETGRLVHVLSPIDLSGVVTSAVDAASAVAPDRSFEVDVPDGEVLIDGDVDRLHQVMVNLLDNAQKSSPAVEPIEVDLAVRDGHAEVSVRDHGAGIAPESLERIFDKFVRERGDTVSGTGLGLYISRQILDAHGGRIWAESEEGEGATFHLTIPLKTAPAKL
jgi:signal transduction histidine kinase/type II secretory pathway pseudopilin PulG